MRERTQDMEYGDRGPLGDHSAMEWSWRAAHHYIFIMNAVVAGVIGGVLLSPIGPQEDPTARADFLLVVLMFFVFGAVSLWLGIAGLVNRTVMQVDASGIRFRHGPLTIVRRRFVRGEEIEMVWFHYTSVTINDFLVRMVSLRAATKNGRVITIAGKLRTVEEAEDAVRLIEYHIPPSLQEAPDARHVAMTHGMRLQRDGHELVWSQPVGARWRVIVAVVIFVCFFAPVALVQASQVWGGDAGTTAIMLPVLLPINLAIGVAVYWQLVVAVNSRRVVGRPNTVLVRQRPLPWPGSHSIRADRIARLVIHEGQRRRDGLEFAEYSIKLHVLAGKRITLAEGIRTADGAEAILRELAEVVELPPEKVMSLLTEAPLKD